jgi:hypothetical protein
VIFSGKLYVFIFVFNSFHGTTQKQQSSFDDYFKFINSGKNLEENAPKSEDQKAVA